MLLVVLYKIHLTQILWMGVIVVKARLVSEMFGENLEDGYVELY
jgi:hypothetical protein